jgi:FkbM family methyltransferase
MLTNLKNIIKKSVIVIARALSLTRLGRLIGNIVIEDVMKRVQSVTHNDIKMRFTVPNQLNYFRVDTFSTKEPETLDWIDSLSSDSTLWDIGANIGLYSIYAAKAKNCQVFAFEPSVFNLELLARNIFLNDLQNQITIIPFALSDKIGSNQMLLTSTEWGGAISTFGKKVSWDGKAIKDIFSFSTFGSTMDYAVSMLNLPQPDYIKIDVDGIEHFILSGGKQVLDKVQSISIEINDEFGDQAINSEKLLKNSGLTFKEKRHSEIFDDTIYSSSFNQIWIRNDK